MRKPLVYIATVCALATLPLSAFAAMQNDEAETAVISFLAEGVSATEIIEILVEDGRSLREATALAVVTASGADRIDLARAGICASGDNPQAEKVSEATIAVVAGSPELVDEIKGVLEDYVTTQCVGDNYEYKAPPSIYSPRETSSGGGGVIPPVSPSS